MKIVVLAGGSDQIALINELHERNHEVILVDYFDNPPAKQFADKHIVASTLDIEAVRNIAVNECADLIVTACTDQALLTVACVSEKLGLPCYISYETALNVTNKSYMKKVMMEHGIPTSKYIIFNETLTSSNFEDFEFPLVVKPVDCNSSKGVIKVYNNEEAKEALNQAISYSRTNSAIIEEFKDGIELSVDCFVQDGIVKLLSVTSSNKIKNNSSFTILQSIYPIINKEEEVKVLNIAQKIAEAFNLKNTPLLVQMIMNQNGYYVLEFSARMGGGSKYKLIETISGVNIMKAYTDLILGENVSIDPSKKVNYASMNYVYCNNGVISSIEGLDSLKEKNIIDEYFVYKTIGMKIEKALTSGDRPIGFMVTSESKDSMNKKIELADKNIKITDENGIDIMKHGLFS